MKAIAILVLTITSQLIFADAIATHSVYSREKSSQSSSQKVVNYEETADFSASLYYHTEDAIIGIGLFKTENAVHEKCEKDGGKPGKTTSRITNGRGIFSCEEVDGNRLYCEAKARTQCFF